MDDASAYLIRNCKLYPRSMAVRDFLESENMFPHIVLTFYTKALRSGSERFALQNLHTTRLIFSINE